MFPLISVIMPTYNRGERLSQAYMWFSQSTYPYKELLIFDDSPKPNYFFQNLKDPDVHYYYFKNRTSIGTKRNFLIEQSKGDVIAHQDDDDMYAPEYLETMLNRLGNNDLVKLSVFNIFNEKTGTKWQWDTRTGIWCFDRTKWGYGFSYVYRKDLYTKRGVKFPNMYVGEDYEFVKRARGVKAKLKQVDDCANLVWHIIHDNSTSTCFPQTQLG